MFSTPVTDCVEGPDCPVCRGRATEAFAQVDGRAYWRCEDCAARFLAPHQRPTPEIERETYLLHRNTPEDAGYRAFLGRLAGPLLERLAPGSAGLDYGCGPGPVLASMLREAGHPMALYDPFFAPDRGALGALYDFITCTEAAEHFHDPARDFARMRSMLRPGGWLAVMTCFQTDDARFARWHYRSDPTHVVFYREQTFRSLAAAWGMTIEVPRKDVVLMRQPAAAP
jgi:hypothetical protein